VVKSDKYMGDSQLLVGHGPDCPPKSTPMHSLKLNSCLKMMQGIISKCTQC